MSSAHPLLRLRGAAPTCAWPRHEDAGRPSPPAARGLESDSGPRHAPLSSAPAGPPRPISSPRAASRMRTPGLTWPRLLAQRGATRWWRGVQARKSAPQQLVERAQMRTAQGLGPPARRRVRRPPPPCPFLAARAPRAPRGQADHADPFPCSSTRRRPSAPITRPSCGVGLRDVCGPRHKSQGQRQLPPSRRGCRRASS